MQRLEYSEARDDDLVECAGVQKPGRAARSVRHIAGDRGRVALQPRATA